jgi:aminopeptidase N
VTVSRASGGLWLLLALAAPAAAGGLPAGIQPLHYQLTITPDFGTRSYAGDLTIDLQVVTPTTRITLDAVDLEIIDSMVTLPSGHVFHPSVTPDPAAGTVTFTLPTRLLPGTVKLHLEYDGRLRSDGRGFYLVASEGRKYLLSQMEATDARRAFPCFDQPALKASVALSAVVDDGLTAISNGPLVSDTPGPKAGKHTMRFGTTPKISSYLVALAVGDFQCLDGTAESVPVRVCAVPERKALGRFALDAAEHALAFDVRYFTVHYPFRKLDLVAVPGNFPGAMENAGAIFFDEGLLVDPANASESDLARTASVLSHEIAHQWLGDIVTMSGWDDLWLNEGFATWMAPKALAGWKPQWHLDVADTASVGEAMRLDALASTRAVRTPVSTPAEIDESFDAMAYDKAGAVIRMVEAWMGPDAFRTGLNAFIREHAFGVASGDDLWTELQNTTGLPVTPVMSGFITRPGVPEVSVASSCDGAETVVTASVRRFSPGATPAAADSPSWAVPLGLRGIGGAAAATTPVTVLLTGPSQTFRLPGCFPAVFANAGATGYYHSAYQADELSRLASAALQQLTPAERLRLLDDAWDLTRAGHQSVGESLALVAALATDPTPEIVEEIDHELTFVRDYLVPGSEHTLFESWVSRVFGPVQETLGWHATAGESEDRARVRVALLDIMGRAARDEKVLATAHSMADAHLAGKERLDPAISPVVVRLAALTADAGLLARLQSIDTSDVLAATGDAAFVTRALDDAVGRTQGRDPWPEWVAAALSNPSAQDAAWKVVTSHWSQVRPAFAEATALSALVTAAGRLCDGESRASVGQFFADKTAAIPRALHLTLDRIDACRETPLRLDAPLAAWLKSPSSRTPQDSRLQSTARDARRRH